jgi:hypothetical protein
MAAANASIVIKHLGEIINMHANNIPIYLSLIYGIRATLQ